MIMRSFQYAALLVLALAGTSCRQNVTQLDGALGTIPIFSPASFKERVTAHTSDDIGEPRKFSTYTWYLETERSPSEVEAFYSAHWPNGRSDREDGESDDDITFRNPPLPAEDVPLGESVSVTIKRAMEGRKTQFSISEDVFTRRRPS
jgi:hypothetical protein